MSRICLLFGPDIEAFIAVGNPAVLVVTSVTMVTKSTYSPSRSSPEHVRLRDVRGLERRYFDLMRERRLGDLDCRLYGDRDIDDERELGCCRCSGSHDCDSASGYSFPL